MPLTWSPSKDKKQNSPRLKAGLCYSTRAWQAVTNTAGFSADTRKAISPRACPKIMEANGEGSQQNSEQARLPYGLDKDCSDFKHYHLYSLWTTRRNCRQDTARAQASWDYHSVKQKRWHFCTAIQLNISTERENWVLFLNEEIYSCTDFPNQQITGKNKPTPCSC